jgi:guanylate kinase
VKPPSIDELKIRLKKRSTESEDKINMRIAKASVELATAPQFDVIKKLRFRYCPRRSASIGEKFCKQIVFICP